MNPVRSYLTSLGSSQTAILGILCLGVFSTALDQTVVVAALPSVMLDLEIPLTDLDKASWIVTGYLVSYTVAMPLAGRLSDVYGRIRMFQAALVLFSIGSGASGGCAGLFVDSVGKGASGLRRRRHGPHRSRYGGSHRSTSEEGSGIRTRGRLGGSWVRFGPTLWWGHNRVDWLAVDILAGHTAEPHPDSASGGFCTTAPTLKPKWTISVP